MFLTGLGFILAVVAIYKIVEWIVEGIKYGTLGGSLRYLGERLLLVLSIAVIMTLLLMGLIRL